MGYKEVNNEDMGSCATFLEENGTTLIYFELSHTLYTHLLSGSPPEMNLEARQFPRGINNIVELL